MIWQILILNQHVVYKPKYLFDMERAMSKNIYTIQSCHTCWFYSNDIKNNHAVKNKIIIDPPIINMLNNKFIDIYGLGCEKDGVAPFHLVIDYEGE